MSDAQPGEISASPVLDQVTDMRLERGLAWITDRCGRYARRTLAGDTLTDDEKQQLDRIQGITQRFPDLTAENATSLATAIEQEISR